MAFQIWKNSEIIQNTFFFLFLNLIMLGCADNYSRRLKGNDWNWLSPAFYSFSAPFSFVLKLFIMQWVVVIHNWGLNSHHSPKLGSPLWLHDVGSSTRERLDQGTKSVCGLSHLHGSLWKQHFHIRVVTSLYWFPKSTSFGWLFGREYNYRGSKITTLNVCRLGKINRN